MRHSIDRQPQSGTSLRLTMRGTSRHLTLPWGARMLAYTQLNSSSPLLSSRHSKSSIISSNIATISAVIEHLQLTNEYYRVSYTYENTKELALYTEKRSRKYQKKSRDLWTSAGRENYHRE